MYILCEVVVLPVCGKILYPIQFLLLSIGQEDEKEKFDSHTRAHKYVNLPLPYCPMCEPNFSVSFFFFFFFHSESGKKWP